MSQLKSFCYLLLIFIAFSCGGEKDLHNGAGGAYTTNFEDEVPLMGNLIFTFDHELVPDSVLNYWDTTEYIRFEPAIKGKYMWKSGSELLFSPAGQLKPSTSYKATFTDRLTSLYGKEGLTTEQRTLEFHTPYLEVSDVQSFWAASTDNNKEAYLNFKVSFNYVVNAKEVAQRLEISVNGQPQDIKLTADEVTNDVIVIVPNVAPEDKDYEATVKLKGGLKALYGTTPMVADYEQSVATTSPYKLMIYNITAEHNGVEGTVTVLTSQGVNAKDLKKYIKIEPDVVYSVSTENQGFKLISEDFTADKAYTITVLKGLKGLIGGEVKYDFSQQVSFGKLRPSISFQDKKGVYLSGKGSRQLAINIINVSKVKVQVIKVYENNITNFLGDSYNYYYDDYEGEGYYDDYSTYVDYYKAQSLGDVVWETEYYSQTLPRVGNSRLLKLDFEDKIGNYKGLYVVQVSSDEDYWLKDEKIVSISDIGLIVKDGLKSVTVFANSVKTTKPLSGVKLSFIGRNNQVVGSAVTDANGAATFSTAELPATGFAINMVTATKDGDYNFIPFNKTQVNTSRYDVGGLRNNESGLDAFLYGDRDIYRPGETIHLSAVLRSHEWEKPGQIPVILKLKTPSGKTFKTIRKTLDEQGSMDASVDLPVTTMTGTYTAYLYTSNELYLTFKRISVEEFMPDRIKVTARVNSEEIYLNDSLNLYINATNFFGPPAANRNYEVEQTLSKEYFSAKDYPSYNFYLQNNDTYFKKNVREGKTDENGNAYENYEIGSSYANMGKLKSSFMVTVFDETGRPVNRTASTDIYTQKVFFGIGNVDYYNRTGKVISIPLIGVNKKGKTLSGIKAEVQLIKHEYKTVLSKSGSYFRYTSEKVEKVLVDKIMKLEGTKTKLQYTPELSGSYEVRIYSPDGGTYVSRYFYSYGWGYTSYSSFEVNNEGEITIEADKDSYLTGETAKILLNAPFSGKILVTVESDKVLKSFYMETDKRTASFDLPIPEDYVPAVYITATLFRAHEETELPLTVAHGFAPIKVENPSNKLPVTITAASQSRSHRKQIIKVKTKPYANVTIAAVDEGILQLTDFQTPDPYGFFYQKRALEVNSYDIYPYLFPEYGMVKSSTGGDGMNMKKRINPMTNKRVKLLAFWSGILKADANGEVSYTIDIPQFSGSLRLMAVAYKDKAMGSAEKNMTVADPLVLSSSLPRFLSPGDTIDVPVMLANTTKKEASCKAKISVSGMAVTIGKTNTSIKVPANSEKQVNFHVAAKKQIGQMKVVVTVDAMSEKFLNETELSIRPAAPLQKINGAGIVAAGKSKTITMDVSTFIKNSIDNKLIVSKSPMVSLTKQLQYLVGYPYGCVEQTVSSAFPQLYYGDLVKEMYNTNPDLKNPNYNIQTAIKKLQMMQLYNGGLTYWPGSGHESWYGSVYAAHFLYEARQAGFEIDEDMFDHLLEYLKTKLKERTTVDYYYNSSMHKKIAPKEVAYSLFVLALAGEVDKSTMNYYKSNSSWLALDSKYLLATAYFLIGDKKRFEEVLPTAFEGETSKQQMGGSFYSPIRDESMALYALMVVDPDNKQVPYLAKHVSQYLSTQRYLSTQERIFGLLAMGKIAKESNKYDIKCVVKSDGKTVGTMNNNTITLETADLKGTKITIESTGKGKLYYFWEAEGISSDGSYQEEDSFMKVRKTFYDRYGNVITNNNFKQNDLILVGLSVVSLSSSTIENVAITDILPAGMEIENPRISEVPGTDWIRNASYPTYMDIRDDRINFFVDVYSTIHTYYYVVRAVSLGHFSMGPVGADAMYNGEYHSYNGGGTITVKARNAN